MLSALCKVLMVLVLVLITSCSPGLGVDRQVVERAIAQQVTATQQQLSQYLQLHPPSPPKIKIGPIKIADRQSMTIQNLAALHLRGTYDLTLTWAGHQVTQRQNPFELYLQQQQEGKTWRSAHPITDANGEMDWVTQLIELF